MLMTRKMMLAKEKAQEERARTWKKSKLDWWRAEEEGIAAEQGAMGMIGGSDQE
jgi:hypothetical protein